MQKIKIPEGLINDAEHWPFLQAVKEWEKLVAAIEANNKELENGIVVKGSMYDDGLCFGNGRWQEQNPEKKALLINIEPIKKKSREERAMTKDRREKAL